MLALVAAGIWCGLAPSPSQVVIGLALPFAVIIAVFGLPLASPPVRRVLELPVMRRIGLYSYGFYLWQQLALNKTSWNVGVMPILGLCIAFAISAISYHTVEKYFRRKAMRISGLAPGNTVNRTTRAEIVTST